MLYLSKRTDFGTTITQDVPATHTIDQTSINVSTPESNGDRYGTFCIVIDSLFYWSKLRLINSSSLVTQIGVVSFYAYLK